MVLSVLVLVSRRKSGPVGLGLFGDCLVGDGGGSEALDVMMYGWMDRGMVTDILREGEVDDMGTGLGPWSTGPGAKISPCDWARICPTVMLRRRCDRCTLCRRRS
jgi:hypothetical protein